MIVKIHFWTVPLLGQSRPRQSHGGEGLNKWLAPARGLAEVEKAGRRIGSVKGIWLKWGVREAFGGVTDKRVALDGNEGTRDGFKNRYGLESEQTQSQIGL